MRFCGELSNIHGTTQYLRDDDVLVTMNASACAVGIMTMDLDGIHEIMNEHFMIPSFGAL